jgi:transposase
MRFRFLKHALRQIPGKLLVIWDGSPIHRARAVKDFLASGVAENRLQLEQLPGYAPDLNPDEGIWKHLKYVELKNVWLPNPLGAEGRTAQGQGTFEAQKRRYPRLH